jgi:predicted MPP superfamily phosphohydrolase
MVIQLVKARTRLVQTKTFMKFIIKYFGIRQITLLAVFTLSGVYLHSSVQPNMSTSSLYVSSSAVVKKSIRIALVSDLHIRQSPKAIAMLSELWADIIEQNPDVILLAGDYINDGSSGEGISSIGPAIANVFGVSGLTPVVAVLGNHDHWSGAESWSQYLSEAGVTVLENETVILDSLGTCIRGFGDAFTNHFKYVDFPKECDDMLQISLMHDPAGAFNPSVRGLILAGHTHCGQISIPFVGPVYVPSQAPREAYCGLYQDEQRQVYVSSGVGTSILPLRFNAQSSWDLITIHH